jgi:UDP:flavonoid glycosyltransferase YjiC (YdhE family)
MGRVLLVTWDGGGNVPPAVALGSRLAATGHDVDAYGSPSLAGRFAADGLAFTARDVPDPWDTTAMAVDVARHCARLEPDLVVVDYMLPGAICAAEASRGATAVLVHTLYGALLDGGDHPSPMTMAASCDTVNEARAAIGLAPVDSMGTLLDRAERVVVTSPRELDAPVDGIPGNVRYVGPVFEPAASDAGWTPPPGDDPLVVVSLGTTPMDEASVLQAILDGLDGTAVRVLAMCGDHLAEGDLRLPSNATRTGYVRHGAVLPHADLVIDHAGLGTVLATLAHGLPQLCVPLGRDQPANAAAVSRAGAGVVRVPSSAPDELGAAALDALTDRSMRARAKALARSIGGPGAGDRAVAELSALVTA